MDIKTRILHTKTNIEKAKPNVTPLFQCSSFFSDSDYFYTRKSNPNSVELEELYRGLEDSQHSLCVSNGMAALNLALRLLKPGQRLVLNNLVYGCSYKLCKLVCQHYEIPLDIIDLTEPGNLEKVLKPETGMILFETPTNPFLRTVNISEVSRIAKQYNRDILVVVDNTWATPYYQKPLQLGADICVYSATKYYSGHSDVMGGIISTDDPGLHEKLEECRFYSGAIMDPHSAWLIRRSMQTFCLRMDEHRRTFSHMVRFLEGVKSVETIYTPDVDGHQLLGYGGILFFQLFPRYRDKVDIFMKSLKLFEHGTSMACVVSAVAQPYSGSHASLSEKEKNEMGIKETLIRLCIGFEDRKDLEADLSRAFNEINS